MTNMEKKKIRNCEVVMLDSTLWLFWIAELTVTQIVSKRFLMTV